ncbi:hypothetical protein [Caulobacter vibrioides]|uniref:Uncharacterized protein n=1 Tax=Caulobacter vibrioides (strain NA1000 / CB15N) TaxID=565050 RepID=A0A0H3C6F2_CAUVN|nr:hypothetical protein [Caulobacter vibrioides]YP_002516087.1 hypothetical protein CCNA_00714 [Caulobacter vibrioides NA1000]ACL94179.1 hypothetical protein CCNA_00714 [Caulobacter vibrioides NA1000]AVH77058.1 hypothetical protein CA607_20250 [Caulobacter vibrioides]QXZ52756.1 hypothetical protein KZH45_03500 [Caulobacter vibrioides]
MMKDHAPKPIRSPSAWKKTSAPLTLPVCLLLMLAGVVEDDTVSLILIGAAGALSAAMAWSALRKRPSPPPGQWVAEPGSPFDVNLLAIT